MDKAARVKLAVVVGLLTWAGLLALFLIPSWDSASTEPTTRIIVVLVITGMAIAFTLRLIESAKASHTEQRGNKTILWIDDDDPN